MSNLEEDLVWTSKHSSSRPIEPKREITPSEMRAILEKIDTEIYQDDKIISEMFNYGGS